jgi:hypothetical protein
VFSYLRSAICDAQAAGLALGGSDIELDHAPAMSRVCQQMNMNLAGPEPRAQVPDLGQIQRRRGIFEATNAQALATSVVVAAHEDIIGGGNLRAFQQRENGVDKGRIRGPAPELEWLAVEPGGPVLCRTGLDCDVTPSGFRRAKLDDPRTHNAALLPGAVRAPGYNCDGVHIGAVFSLFVFTSQRFGDL